MRITANCSFNSNYRQPAVILSLDQLLRMHGNLAKQMRTIIRRGNQHYGDLKLRTLAEPLK